MEKYNLKKIKKTFVRRIHGWPNGITCLFSIIKYYDGFLDDRKSDILNGIAKGKVNLFALNNNAKAAGFDAECVRFTTELLKEIHYPVILLIKKSDYEDFIVCYGYENEKFIIGEPDWGIVEYREDELLNLWESKSALILEPNDSFEKTTNLKDKIYWLTDGLKNNKNSIITALLLSLFGNLLLLSITSDIITSFCMTNRGNNIMNHALLIKATIVILVLLINRFLFFRDFYRIIAQLCDQYLEGIFNGDIENSTGLVLNTTKLIKTISKKSLILPHLFLFGISLFLFASFFMIKSSLLFSFLFLAFIVIGYTGLFFIIKKKRFLARNIFYNSSDVIDSVNQGNGSLQFYKVNNLIDSLKSKLINLIVMDIFYKIDIKKKRNKLYWLIILLNTVTLLLIIIYLNYIHNNEAHSLYLWGGILLCGLAVLFYVFIELMMFKVNIDTIYQFFKNPNKEKTNEENEENVEEDVEKNIEINSIEIKDLEFLYPGQLNLFKIKEMSFRVGQIHGIYGKSGTGKTTLLKILNRIYLNTKTKIQINGTGWTCMSDQEWYDSTITIFKDNKIISDSVIGHIMTRSKGSEVEDVKTFCKELGIYRFIEEFPYGYNSLLNGNRNISTTQRIFVDIIAALYGRPKVLMIDNILCEFDGELRKVIMDLLNQVKKDMIIIITTNSEEDRKLFDNCIEL